MIIAFDPVGKEVTIDFEDGRPQIGLPAEKLLVKQYGEDGIFFAEASNPDEVVVGYLPASDILAVIIQAKPLEVRSWHVTAVPA